MGCQSSKPLSVAAPSKKVSGVKNVALAKSVVEAETLNNFDTQSRYSYRPVEQDFVVETHVLGEGLCGAVTKATNRLSGQECALKVLKKDGLSQRQLGSLRSEVNNYLKIDHPHIARLLHVYEDDHRVCLVMELCAGKELFDRLAAKKQLNEKEASRAVYQILLSIAYLHKHGIAHCDLKLENVLFDDVGEEANLKLIDFGFSKRWSPHNMMHACEGSVGYTAPEVLGGSDYTDKCDMWSLGVIVYMLLAGHMPFSIKDRAQHVSDVMAGQYSFRQDRWACVSEQAIDFVKRLLVLAPDERMSAEECLGHPWLSHMASGTPRVRSPTSGVPESVSLLQDLRSYSHSSHLTRAVLSMIAHHLTSADLDQIQETFLSLDTDRTGTITRENFRAALRGHLDLAEEEIAQLFEKVDVAHDNEIHYSEFVAAVMPFRIGIQRRQVREAFALFDVSRTGFITLNDLRDVFGGNNFGQVSIDTIIAECEGCDSKTGISFEQFSMHLRKDGTAGPAHDFAKGAPSCCSADSTRASANSLAI